MAQQIRISNVRPRKKISDLDLSYRTYWQTDQHAFCHVGNRLSVVQRNPEAFDADIEFEVGNQQTGIETVKGHRLLLISGSPVFEAMFRPGAFREGNGKVKVVDCSPDGFKAFMRYIYNDRDKNFTEENVFEVLMLAKKYQVPGLARLARIWVYRNLHVSNALKFYEAAKNNREDLLVRFIFGFVCAEAETIIESLDVKNISSEFFWKLIVSPFLNVPEGKAYEMMMTWAQGRVDEIQPTGNLTAVQYRSLYRKVLGLNVYELRVTLLSMEEVTKVKGPLQLLLYDDEASQLIRFKNKLGDFDYPFAVKPRKKDPRYLEYRADFNVFNRQGHRCHSIEGIRFVVRGDMAESLSRIFDALWCDPKILKDKSKKSFPMEFEEGGRWIVRLATLNEDSFLDLDRLHLEGRPVPVVATGMPFGNGFFAMRVRESESCDGTSDFTYSLEFSGEPNIEPSSDAVAFGVVTEKFIEFQAWLTNHGRSGMENVRQNLVTYLKPVF